MPRTCHTLFDIFNQYCVDKLTAFILCQEVHSINNLVWLKPCMVYSMYASIFSMIQKNYPLNYWALLLITICSESHGFWIISHIHLQSYVLCTCFCIVISNCFSVIFVYFITRLSILIDTYRWFSLWNSLRRKKLRDRNTYLCIKYNSYFVKKNIMQYFVMLIFNYTFWFY